MFLAQMFQSKNEMPDRTNALKGRPEPIPTSETHFVNGAALKGPFPENAEVAYFGMGCFWGVERLFWKLPGVLVTAAGYQGGYTPNPTYHETVTGRTGHTEVVMVVYDPTRISYEDLLKVFWEEHDPTQGMRQGNDVGTTYRSAIYTTTEEQRRSAEASRNAYQDALKRAGVSKKITTEIKDVGEAGDFFYAEDYHQQYLAKNPGGYCGLKGTGVDCPVGTGVTA